MNELEKAVDLVENGWCTGALLEDGKVCAAGAIYAASMDMSATGLREMPLQEAYDFERQAARYVEASESGKALADEIIEQGKNTTPYDGPYSVIWQFNDRIRGVSEITEADIEAHKHEVIEMMKRAAKRLN